MIFFVDEDVTYAKEFRVPLVMRGYKVEIISNADRALDILEKSNKVDLAIIDIMLATAEKEISRFSAEETADFVTTGLLLMRYLIDKRPSVFPKKFVVLTAAGGPKLLPEIERQCRAIKVPVFRKSNFREPKVLADRLEKLLK